VGKRPLLEGAVGCFGELFFVVSFFCQLLFFFFFCYNLLFFLLCNNIDLCRHRCDRAAERPGE